MRRILFLIISKCVFCAFLHAQTVEQTYSDGYVALQKNDITTATKLLQRAAFFAGDSLKICAQIALADCFVIRGEYTKAQSFYDMAFLQTPTDSQQHEIIFRKASCYILASNPAQALEVLDRLPFEMYTQRLSFYKGIAWYKMAQFDSSKYYFARSALPQARDSLEKIFQQLSKINRLSPKKAKTLSILLPGLGQLYTKDYKNAINSFLLNGTLVSLGVVSYIHYSLFDALLFAGPWWWRYYAGGFKKAEIIAANKLQKDRNQVLDRIVDTIANNNLN